jgi:hypothetical protein
MPIFLPRRKLLPQDELVLREVTRFGALARDQIERHYADTALAARRIQTLLQAHYLGQWQQHGLADVEVYTATPLTARAVQLGYRRPTPRLNQLAHDLALVDLAAYLLAKHPGASWLTEREAARALRGGSASYWSGRRAGGVEHRPDGLLVLGCHNRAVELEHSAKSVERYGQICRWYACALRVDSMYWYVDDAAIERRLRKALDDNFLTNDVNFRIEPFPPGVALRRIARPGVPA